MHPIAYIRGQWTRQAEPYQVRQGNAVAGPGPVPPPPLQHLPQTVGLMHTYHMWASGDYDLYHEAFVWDSRTGMCRYGACFTCVSADEHHFSFLFVPEHTREALPRAIWCRWHLLDKDLEWLHNCNAQFVPQNMRYQVTTGNAEGQVWTHTVMFSIPLHLACLGALARFDRRFLHSPSARSPNTHRPLVFRDV